MRHIASRLLQAAIATFGVSFGPVPKLVRQTLKRD